MDLGIEGRAALVCGASQGLGYAIARELAREGADLVICSRSPERIEAARDTIAAETGARVIAVAADLTDPDGVGRVARTALETLGRVDILVTNTGGPPSGPFESHSAEAWKTAIAQNLESVINLVREVLPGMKERGWGRIVNVTSITVKQPVGGLILSNAVRAAVTGFAKTVANEAAPFGVTVNNVLPGFTRTERLRDLAAANSARGGVTEEEVYGNWEREIPMGRLGEPDELAGLAAFLASERASYITGQSVAVDGGWIKGLL
ncbi:MAG: SDR family oxidoreductase [Gemmatimonadota bacterium]|nr:SDR family oxidoreductase [Gemmatimonadota bacterium]